MEKVRDRETEVVLELPELCFGTVVVSHLVVDKERRRRLKRRSTGPIKFVIMLAHLR